MLCHVQNCSWRLNSKIYLYLSASTSSRVRIFIINTSITHLHEIGQTKWRLFELFINIAISIIIEWNITKSYVRIDFWCSPCCRYTSVAARRQAIIANPIIFVNTALERFNKGMKYSNSIYVKHCLMIDTTYCSVRITTKCYTCRVWLPCIKCHCFRILINRGKHRFVCEISI